MALLRKPAPPDPRTQRRLRIERAVLALVTVVSLGWSLWWAWDLAHTPGFSLLVQRGDATRISAMMYLVPPLAMVAAWLILGETITPLALMGFALSAAGVYIVGRKTASG